MWAALESCCCEECRELVSLLQRSGYKVQSLGDIKDRKTYALPLEAKGKEVFLKWSQSCRLKIQCLLRMKSLPNSANPIPIFASAWSTSSLHRRDSRVWWKPGLKGTWKRPIFFWCNLNRSARIAEKRDECESNICTFPLMILKICLLEVWSPVTKQHIVSIYKSVQTSPTDSQSTHRSSCSNTGRSFWQVGAIFRRDGIGLRCLGWRVSFKKIQPKFSHVSFNGKIRWSAFLRVYSWKLLRQCLPRLL